MRMYDLLAGYANYFISALEEYDQADRLKRSRMILMVEAYK